jgi:hypothetical protein
MPPQESENASIGRVSRNVRHFRSSELMCLVNGAWVLYRDLVPVSCCPFLK